MPDIGSAIAGGSALLGFKSSGDAADAQQAANNAAIAEQRRQFDTALNLQMPAINTGNVARSQLASILGLTVPGSSTVGGTMSNSGGISPSDLQGVLRAGQGPFGYLGQKRALRDLQNRPAPENNVPDAAPMSNEAVMELISNYPGFQFAVDQARKASTAQASATGSSPISGNVLTALQGDIAGRVAMPAFSDYTNRLAALSGAAQTASSGAGAMALNTGANVGQLLSNSGDARASGIIGGTNSILGGLGGILDEYNRWRNPGGINGGETRPPVGVPDGWGFP